MRIKNERQQLNDSLIDNAPMDRAIGFDRGLLTCLSLSTGYSGNRSASRLIEAGGEFLVSVPNL